MKEKLRELLDKYDLNEYKLTKYTGAGGRTNTLEHILDGEREITSTNLNLLSAFARGLGVKLEDILDDFDIDGSTSQVLAIERKKERVRKTKGTVDIEYPNGGFVKGLNIREDLGKIPLKTKYEFLNPKLKHEDQPTNEIYLMNNAFLSRDPKFDANRNESLTNISPRFNAHAWSYFIYSPLKDGGDIKVVVSVWRENKDNEFLFTEIYGCEWINRDDNKSICYYKYHNDYEPLNLDQIKNAKKIEISELEFYRGFMSQFQKFGLVVS